MGKKRSELGSEYSCVYPAWLSPTKHLPRQNNNDEDPNCAGIEGVLESYFQSLRTVQLYGPTYFAPVINQVAR